MKISDNNGDDDNDCGTGLCSEFVIFIWFYEIQYSLFMVINTNQVISLYIYVSSDTSQITNS